MTVVACLSWFDEPVEALDRCVRSLAGVADRLLAVDGRFEHFPSPFDRSSDDQYEAIAAAAVAAGVDVTIASRAPCSQVAKRAGMMEMAVELAGGGWCLVIDADEHVGRRSDEFHQRLAAVVEDVAFVDFRWLEFGSSAKSRRLFRALPGLTVRSLHYRYMVGERILWGSPGQAATADLSRELWLFQDPARPVERAAARRAYYDERRRLNVESL